MKRPTRRGRTPRVESLAGWVFADLLLVLFIIGLGTQVTKAEEEPLAPPEREPVVELGMEQTALIRTVTVDPGRLLSGDAGETQRVADEVRRVSADLDGRRAGMVLIWGHSPDVGRGQDLARAVGDLLESAVPTLFDGGAEKYLWNGEPSEGPVELEIYLFTEEPRPPAQLEEQP